MLINLMETKMMMSRLMLLMLGLAATVGPASIASSRDPSHLTVHEWGTFTSVAGPAGQPVEWWTLGGGQDLPCFVERFELGKGGGRGTVRMETPVVYFYAPQASTVDVEVQFRQGIITEWFPHATLTPKLLNAASATSGFRHKLVWSDINISPNAAEDYQQEPAPSHYYAARNTDAAPLQVAGQKEKFLFYRGVGSFSIPISATIAEDGRIVAKNTGRDPIASAILFENQGGQIGFRIHHGLNGEIVWAPPALTGDFRKLTAELEQALTAEGLYPKEARAMIETWRDTWFEQGSRIFYIVPTRMIDDVLPLNIQPQPSQVARVFVGRVELITASAQSDVANAIAQRNPSAAAKYGRLLPSILDRLFPPAPTSDSERLRAHRILEPVYASLNAARRSCATPPRVGAQR